MTAQPTRVRSRGGGGILLVGWVALVGVLAVAAWLGGREVAPVPATPAPNIGPSPTGRSPSPSPSPSTAVPVSVVLPRPGDIVAGSAIELVVDITRHVGRVEAAVYVAGVAVGRTWFDTTIAGRFEIEVGLLAPFDSVPAELVLTPLGGGSPTSVPIRLESTDRVRVLYPADGQEIVAGSLASRGASAVAAAVIVGTAAGAGAATADSRIVAELRAAGRKAIAAAGSGSAGRGGIASSFALPLHADVPPPSGNAIVAVSRGADRASSRVALVSTPSPGDSPPRANEALDDLSFTYPSSWQETRFAGPLPFRGTADGLLAYAANGLLNTCRLDRSLGDARAGEACEWPLGRLGPGQLLVAWFRAADGWLLPGAAGASPPSWFDVDGRPAAATLQLGGLCAPIGLATLEVDLAGPGHPARSAALDRPIVTHRFVGCLGGGTRRQVGREIESALDVVASARWADAAPDVQR